MALEKAFFTIYIYDERVKKAIPLANQEEDMASRKDSKGYALRTGETQRADGRYCFSYQDKRGKRHYRYAKTLVALRDIEKDVRRDMEDGLDSAHADKITLNEMYDKYMAQKYNLKPSTITY